MPADNDHVKLKHQTSTVSLRIEYSMRDLICDVNCCGEPVNRELPQCGVK